MIGAGYPSQPVVRGVSMMEPKLVEFWIFQYRTGSGKAGGE
jgi:hypothetical protein